jgi:hypothetical protein
MNQDQESILDKIISTQQVSHREHFRPQAVLTELLQGLGERERQVLARRFGFSGSESETLESIGNSFQVTRERIRQIQRLAVQKIVQGKRAQELLRPIRQVVVEVLEGESGAATSEKLGHLLQESGDGASLNVINFYLSEILTDVVASLGGEETEFILGWRLRNASLEAITNIINHAQDFISTKGHPISEDELVRELARANLPSPLGGSLNDGRLAVGLLELSVNVRSNTFGEWGLTHWQTVSPKRMNDKIYLVLKKHGKPLHFREITKLVNEQKFDHKMAYPPTVHNELIMDKKYVLVGRGIYALKEWGFNPGVVADILVEILKTKGPLDRSQIVEDILKQRLVKKGTIHLALTNKQKFQRLPDGRYTLATPNNQT